MNLYKLNYKIISLIFVIFIVVGGIVYFVSASGGVYSGTKHGNSSTGVNRITTEDKGSCFQCHNEHSTSNPYSLFTTNTNSLCYTAGAGPCHANQSSITNPVYMGQTIYENANMGHAKNTNCYWRGTDPSARASSYYGKCLNCHNPHSRAFGETTDTIGGPYSYTASSAIPDNLTRLEENLCFGCHDGTVTNAANIKSQFTTTPANASPTFYTHPVDQGLTYSTPSYHTVDETKALTSTNRHVECVDCHNPHYCQNNGTVGVSTHSPGTNQLSQALLGVYGVIVSTWPTSAIGTLPNPPTFTLTQLTSTTTHYEWNLCFRCHSSYSTLPTFAVPNNVTDVSKEFNPNNLAYHPIVSTGKNQSANANYQNTFEYLDKSNTALGRWGKTKTLYCSDCHSIDNSTYPSKGPHGSGSKWVLAKFNDGGTMRIICYKCHRRDVYGDSGYTPPSASLSRVSHPMNSNHTSTTYNVWGIWCMSCHGGNIAGGMHGVNQGLGSKGGTSNLGEHFMNGACIDGFTKGTGGSSGSGKCWTSNVNSYNLSCTDHGSGRTFTPNYEY